MISSKTDSMRSPQQPEIEFPCDFPIKVMGRQVDDIAALAVSIIRDRVPEFDPACLTHRQSQGGTYISVTATIRATSREQLDEIYSALTARDEILMVL